MKVSILATVLAGVGGALALPASASEVTAAAEIDTLAWQEAQQEMAAGEVMPAGEDWDRILAQPTPTSSPVAEEGGILPGTGSLAWRLATTPEGWSSQMGRLYWQDQGIALKLRSRWYPGQQPMNSGMLGFDYHSQRLKGGDLGLVHGYGLLVDGPGRGRSLDPTSTLTLGSSRLVASLGAPAGQTVRGLAASFRASRVQVLVVNGLVIDSKGRSAAKCLVLGGSLNDEFVHLGLLFKRQGDEPGGSLTASWSTGGLSLGTEVAMWQPQVGRPVTGAWVAYLGWRETSAHRLEAVLASSSATQGNLLGRRPFILGGWSGRGWALRWVGRWSRTVTLRVLASRNYFRQSPRPADQARTDLGEVRLRFRIRTGSWLAVGARSRRKLAWVRSPSYPWQAPVQELKEGKTLLSLQGGWERDPLEVFFLLRSLESWAGNGRGRRQLLGWNARLSLAGGWLLRGGWGMAWGDQEDLVSALSPLPGYVLPRHWGRWVEETMIGVAWSSRRWSLAAACARRFPDPDQGGIDVIQAWTEIRYHW